MPEHDARREIPEEDFGILHGPQVISPDELAAYRKLFSHLNGDDVRSLARFVLVAFSFRAQRQHCEVADHRETELEFHNFLVKALQVASMSGAEDKVNAALGHAESRNWFTTHVERGDASADLPIIYFPQYLMLTEVGLKFLRDQEPSGVAAPRQTALKTPVVTGTAPTKTSQASCAPAVRPSTPVGPGPTTTDAKGDPVFQDWPVPEGKAAIHKHFIAEITRLYGEIRYDRFRAGALSLGRADSSSFRREDRTDWLNAMVLAGHLRSNNRKGSACKYWILTAPPRK